MYLLDGANDSIMQFAVGQERPAADANRCFSAKVKMLGIILAVISVEHIITSVYL